MGNCLKLLGNVLGTFLEPLENLFLQLFETVLELLGNSYIISTSQVNTLFLGPG